MYRTEVPVLGFAAFSGTGKTTLLTQLIPALNFKGLRVGLIKHSHHDFEIDQPGKDSFRLRIAGASPVLLVSKYRRAIITEFSTRTEPTLFEQLKYFEQEKLDLILVEGFRDESFPKIELHRSILDNPLLYPNDNNIVAIASDVALSTPASLVNLDINNPDQIADYIHQHFIAKS